MDKQLVDKFLNNNCTSGEVARMLKWLKTDEGQQYLEEKMEQDSQLLQDERIKPLIPEIESQKMWKAVEQDLESTGNQKVVHGKKPASFWYVAVTILIIVTSSLFYYTYQQVPQNNQAQEVHQPVVYKTGENQQKKLTLSDGTEIHLNSNTRLWLSEEFGKEDRTVRLEGEAFFSVVHDEERPFVVQVKDATIKDLGTAFNIKTDPSRENVQVAVTEGIVTVRSAEQPETEVTELTEGQYAYFDLINNSIEVDEFSISNYLSWRDGSFKFEEAPLEKVSEQLARIYGVSLSYSDSSLKKRKLSSNFQQDSLSKVLEVVSLTLGITYEKQGEQVTWISKESNQQNIGNDRN